MPDAPSKASRACGGVPCGKGPGLCAQSQLWGPISGPGGLPSAWPGVAPLVSRAENGFHTLAFLVLGV